MELENLSIISRSTGQALSSQELSNLEIGLVKRNAAEKCFNVQFWGKISGTKSDYIIAVSLLKTDEYPKKKFYFCTNISPELQQLPECTEDTKIKASSFRERLTGDPSLPLEPEIEGGEANNTFREVDRLSCIVMDIDNSVSAIPCGAYNMGSSHAVILNDSFNGLSWEKATQLKSYFHFRAPIQPELKELIKGDGLVRDGDFLDPISADAEGLWSLKVDNTKAAVILRSMQYPGHVFFHKPRTGVYGSAYFGSGMKNDDISFML